MVCFNIEQDGDDDSQASILMTLVPAVLFSPVVYWVYLLNEFEKHAPISHRFFILFGLLILLGYYVVSALITVRFRQYVADSEMRDAIVLDERLIRQNTLKKQSRYRRKKTGVEVLVEKFSLKVQSWNLSGNFFKPKDTGVEFLSRKTEFIKREKKKRLVLPGDKKNFKEARTP